MTVFRAPIATIEFLWVSEEEEFRMPKVDTGDLGEADFLTWCIRAGMTAVKAIPDRKGWDYFVEFEDDVNYAVPLDRHRNHTKVLVQVKAAKSNSRAVRGKLSAFRCLVEADLPAFVVHITYSARGVCGYLLHIGQAEIEAVLRRIRRAEKEGRSDLHNINLSLPLAPALKIESDGSNLRQLILRTIPNGTPEYVRAKASFRSGCGYVVTGSFDLASGNQEGLVNLLLGIVPNLPFAGVHDHKEPFWNRPY